MAKPAAASKSQAGRRISSGYIARPIRMGFRAGRLLFRRRNPDRIRRINATRQGETDLVHIKHSIRRRSMGSSSTQSVRQGIADEIQGSNHLPNILLNTLESRNLSNHAG